MFSRSLCLKLPLLPFPQSKHQPHRRGEYNVYSTFQSHEPEFDYLKSLEIEEKINKIRWLPQQNAAYFLLSTNGTWPWLRGPARHAPALPPRAWQPGTARSAGLLGDKHGLTKWPLPSGHHGEQEPGQSCLAELGSVHEVLS